MSNTGTKDNRFFGSNPEKCIDWMSKIKVFCPSIGHVVIQSKILSQNRQSDQSVPVLVVLPSVPVFSLFCVI